MGMIIILFLAGVLIISVISFIRIFIYILDKQIGLKEILLGMITSVIIFGLISLSYIIEGQASAFSPAFRLPIIMVIIPFIIHTLTEKSKNTKLAYFSLVLLASIGVTTILGIALIDLWLGLLDHLGIEKYY
ncbi:hypothetical protein PF327_01340 [Sulfurovum sp. XTW-4]|uniref:Uncharacterized protein n=1 Tax=Sulfurovum xiamenensis TaxID=3019066 RepID=A0ABT7QP30_9BACT|nr:hypothetical protein [Sulfurovum xiamenensis]MDM5262832.1 hypothetical protein [Sulfurovum xiamenensis]